MKFIFILTGVAVAAAVAIGGEAVFAYVMSSPNYQLKSDSINVGGVRQNSDNYISEDTMGEIATGISTTTSYMLYAGYQQVEGGYIALSLPTSTTLSPSIGGITGGQSNAFATATVTTDSPTGYSLSVDSLTFPALTATADNFFDYSPQVAGTPDYDWLVAVSESGFGFTVDGGNIKQKFKDNGVNTCAVGSGTSSDTCWYHFSTTSEALAQSFSSNHPNGDSTVVKLRAESGNSHLQIADTYQATLQFTAVTN